jgi:TetR/AcrR family transcriptional regulator, mexJK operon transcriptional repressor
MVKKAPFQDWRYMRARTSTSKSHAIKEEGHSERKRRGILVAGTELFLKSGYLGTNMDDIAALSAVSKQTVYKHFSSKEALFVEIVSSMTGAASDTVHKHISEIADDNVAAFLEAYAYRQLTVVLTPRLMQLRRLVIGEAGRFPELARVLYERGPRRAISVLAKTFEDLASKGLLVMDDSAGAADQFNWLVMSAPLNRVMLLGDGAIPKASALRRHAAESVRVFLAAYGKKAS